MHRWAERSGWPTSWHGRLSERVCLPSLLWHLEWCLRLCLHRACVPLLVLAEGIAGDELLLLWLRTVTAEACSCELGLDGLLLLLLLWRLLLVHLHGRVRAIRRKPIGALIQILLEAVLLWRLLETSLLRCLLKAKWLLLLIACGWFLMLRHTLSDRFLVLLYGVEKVNKVGCWPFRRLADCRSLSGLGLRRSRC